MIHHPSIGDRSKNICFTPSSTFVLFSTFFASVSVMRLSFFGFSYDLRPIASDFWEENATILLDPIANGETFANQDSK